MATLLDICNQALARIGVRQFIGALTDPSVEAKVCNLHYEQVLDSVLQAFPWPFARKDVELVLLPESSLVDYQYAYALPTDCVFARSLWPGMRAPRADQRIPFYISAADGTRAIYCDLPPNPAPILLYTARIWSTCNFPPLFVDAFSALLASRIAMPLAVQPALKNAALQDYLLAVSDARATALRESQEEVLPDSEFIACR